MLQLEFAVGSDATIAMPFESLNDLERELAASILRCAGRAAAQDRSPPALHLVRPERSHGPAQVIAALPIVKVEFFEVGASEILVRFTHPAGNLTNAHFSTEGAQQLLAKTRDVRAAHMDRRARLV